MISKNSFVRSSLALASAWLPMSCAGCGTSSDGLIVAPVTGVVLFDGEPLSGARVEFRPVEVPKVLKKGVATPSAVLARTDGEGQYELRYDARRRGAVPGKYTVCVTTIEPGADHDRPIKEKIPPKYNRQTTLVFDVGSEPNNIDIDLISEKTKGR